MLNNEGKNSNHVTNLFTLIILSLTLYHQSQPCAINWITTTRFEIHLSKCNDVQLIYLTVNWVLMVEFKQSLLITYEAQVQNLNAVIREFF